MVFTSNNNFSEGWTIVLLFLNEVPISLLHIDNMLLFTLVHRAIPMCMEKGPKSRIVHFLLHIIACNLSLHDDCVMVLLPIVNTFPQVAALF
jgi:hypothetical protein